MRSFYLMNKSEMVLQFGIDKTLVGLNYIFQKQGSGILPVGFRDLASWLSSRFILSHRRPVMDLFSSLGITDLDDYLDITNCISVNDTYWVKGVGSNKVWDNVSPYRNGLNRFISEYSFNGSFSGSRQISSSPDFSTDGTFPKCWRKRNGVLELCKAGTEGYSNAGLEPYSEVFAYQLASYLGFDSVKYSLGTCHGKLVSLCSNMCNEDVGLVPLSDIMGVSSVNFEDVLTFVKVNIPDSYKHLINMLVLDTLICNVDRHLGNIGVFVDNRSQKVLSLSKIYDNNLSCIPYYVRSDDLIEYLESLLSKDGRSFNALYCLLKSSYASSLCRKAINFRFKPLNEAKADCRLKILNAMLKYRIRENLSI